MKKYLYVANVFVLLLLSSAYAQLTFWTTQIQPERMAVQEQIVADFEAATGISVDIVPVEESALSERVTAAFGAGALPDVIYHPLSLTVGWAEAGILNTAVATEIIEDLGIDTFASGALELASVENGYTAVPSDGWTQLLVYRKDLFEKAGLEPPTNFENILAAIEALHNPPEMYGFVAATDVSQAYMMQVLEHFFLANGVNLLSEDGSEVALPAETTIEVLEFYDKLAAASPPGNLYWQQSRQLYLAGRAAMIVWSPFILDELAGLRDSVPVTAFEDPTSRELAERTGFVTRLSGPSNPEGAGWASISYFGITVDADIEPAKQFVEYIMTDAYLDWLSFAPEGLFPVHQGTPDDPDKYVEGWKQLPVGVDRKAPLSEIYPAEVIDALLNGLEVASRWAYSKGEGEIIARLYGTRVMSELVRSFIDGELSAQETVEQLHQRISALR